MAHALVDTMDDAAAMGAVTLRHLGKTEAPLTVTFYFVFIGT